MTGDGRQKTAGSSRLHRVFIRLCLISSVLCLLACAKEPSAYQEQGYVFGTLVDISIYGEDEAHARQAAGEVLREFQRLHDMLHAWQPSELSTLNTAFATGKSQDVTPELEAMLQDAAQLAHQSQGTFNPAIGKLIELWGFHADEFKPVQPDETQIATLVAANPQMNDIVFGQGAVESRNPAVQLDLGGYAKGYALDRAATLLKQRGVRNALINIGGNILALGQHGKRAWRVGIQHPRKSGALATLELHDGEAIGTSGDYQRYFESGGKRYCHLIDPRTGYPVQGVQAVTVLTRGCRAGVLSDAASKPLFIAGTGGWHHAAQQMDLSEAMLVDAQGAIHLTAALRKRLEFADRDARFEIMP
ncbi:MAG TPA: FAD:protein FMN transferase [Gallionella sp.]|nr:FAD:protein FMN transferase [Gallionella sp.]